MTLDEAIKHAEEVAEEKEKLANIYESFKDYGNPKSSITSGHKKCLNCAEEHRQISEWLKELKQLREQESVIDKIRTEIIDTLYVDSLIFGELIDFRNGKINADDVIDELNRVTKIEVLQIIDKYKVESEDKVESENKMDKCFICNKEIQRDSIPRIKPKLNKIMLNEGEEEHPVCDACGNLLSLTLKINGRFKNTKKKAISILP